MKGLVVVNHEAFGNFEFIIAQWKHQLLFNAAQTDLRCGVFFAVVVLFRFNFVVVSLLAVGEPADIHKRVDRVLDRGEVRVKHVLHQLLSDHLVPCRQVSPRRKMPLNLELAPMHLLVLQLLHDCSAVAEH